MNVTCFNNPDEEHGSLSNWYYSDFSIDDVEYTSMEQYMMYQKAIRFQDISIAEEILATQDVAQIKELGRSVSGYNDNIWSGIRQIVVYEGLKAKFAQNDNLRRQLVETQDAILAECAVKDCIWGIGLSMHDPKRLNPEQWRGKNLLWYTLMMVRDGIYFY